MVSALKACLKNTDVVGAIGTFRHPIRLVRSVYFAKRRRFLVRAASKKGVAMKIKAPGAKAADRRRVGLELNYR